eukprot:jgi/Tetstr1/459078/TSEL_004528.t1
MEQRILDILSSLLTSHTLRGYAGKLSQFAEFYHDSENISPLEATKIIPPSGLFQQPLGRVEASFARAQLCDSGGRGAPA